MSAPAFGVIVLLLFGFAFSEEMVTAVLEAFGRDDSAAPIIVIAVDAVILLLVGVLKRIVDRIDGGGPGLKRIVDRIDGGGLGLWGWWWTGAVTILACDLLLSLMGAHPPVWADQLLAVLLAVAMGLVLVSSLNADPLTLVSARKRAEMPLDWQRVRAVVPLVIGSYAAYAGAALWWDARSIDVMRELDPAIAAEIPNIPVSLRGQFFVFSCWGAVSPRYFDQMAYVIPMLLITLGIEAGFFRRHLRDPIQRVSTGVVVMVMSLGLVGALSTLPWEGLGCGQVLSKWHEYIVFVLTLQAVFMGLATLVWQLLVALPDARPGPADDAG
ncbi:hypothetical protein [Mycobacterium sp. M26]|uniref:hypothetical protein n=1 Tax=Mycobacterium sp. M26 TaxID=1762962 RepID=UPI0009EB89CD|nr:hypothetical protein [Mycobacterium sp. M26]